MPRVEVVAIAASLGAIAAGLLLIAIGCVLDPARAARRALKRR